MSKGKEEVLDYMRNGNRPYSVNDVFASFQNQYTKAAIQKYLDDLVSKKKLLEKTYGKQKVYAIIHSNSQTPGQIEVELKAIDARITRKKQEIQKEEQLLKELTAAKASYEAGLPTEKAIIQRETLKENIAKLHEKLNHLQENKLLVSKEEQDRIKSRLEKVEREGRKRKRICEEIMQAVLENYPKSKKQFVEEVGLELDD